MRTEWLMNCLADSTIDNLQTELLMNQLLDRIIDELY